MRSLETQLRKKKKRAERRAQQVVSTEQEQPFIKEVQDAQSAAPTVSESPSARPQTSSEKPLTAGSVALKARRAEQKKAVQKFLLKRRARMLRTVFNTWAQQAAANSALVSSIRTKVSIALMARMFSVWRIQLRAKRRRIALEENRRAALRAHKHKKMAEEFDRTRLLASTFLSWQLWTQKQVQVRKAREVAAVTRERMARVLAMIQDETAQAEDSLKSTNVSQTPAEHDSGLSVVPRQSTIDTITTYQDGPNENTEANQKAAQSTTITASLPVGNTKRQNLRYAQGGAAVARTLPLPTAPKVASTFRGMEERAKKREEMRLARLERQKAKEDEKRAAVEAAAAEAERAEREARKDAARKRRELKQAEEERAKEATQRKERLIQNKLKAEEHHRLAVMKWYGLKPWTSLIQKHNDLRQQADVKRVHTLLRRSFCVWRESTVSLISTREARADTANVLRIKKAALLAWCVLHRIARIFCNPLF